MNMLTRIQKEVYLILDNIRSKENVGSIFRTADAAGVSKIYLCGITPTPKAGNSQLETLNSKPQYQSKARYGARQIQNSKFQIQSQDKIAKTALGAEKWVLWEYRKQTWRCLLELKSKNEKLKIIGLEKTKNSKNIFEFAALDISPLALVVGNEVRGLSPQILKYCDEVVYIPMYGRKESLNVAVAAGIALYTLISKIKIKYQGDRLKIKNF